MVAVGPPPAAHGSPQPLQVGQRVLGLAAGSLGTHVEASARTVVPLPPGLSATLAATAPTVRVTVATALQQMAAVDSNDRYSFLPWPAHALWDVSLLSCAATRWGRSAQGLGPCGGWRSWVGRCAAPARAEGGSGCHRRIAGQADLAQVSRQQHTSCLRQSDCKVKTNFYDGLCRHLGMLSVSNSRDMQFAEDCMVVSNGISVVVNTLTSPGTSQ